MSSRPVGFTEDDIKVLQRFLDQVKRAPANTRGRGDRPEPDATSPDVLVFLTPAEGIAPIGDESDHPGTGSSGPDGSHFTNGTGTFGPANFSACEAYRLSRKTNCFKYTGYTKQVLNLTSTRIAGRQLIIGVRDKYGQWIAVSTLDPTAPLSDLLIPVTATRRNGTHYAWTRDSFMTGDIQVQGTEEEGTVAAQISVEHTQTQDGLNPDIWVVTEEGPTGGTFELSEDGSSLGDVAYDASDGTINGLLSVFSCSTAITTSDEGVKTYTRTFTSSDASTDHTIGVLDLGANLEPSDHHYPVLFRNDTAMDVPVAGWISKGGGGEKKIVVTKVQDADGSSRHVIFDLRLENFRAGKYKLRFTKTDAWQELDWNALDTDIETALDTLLDVSVVGGDMPDGVKEFQIEVLEDFDDHDLLWNADDAIGTQFYVWVWSNGNQCTGMIGGVDPKEATGYQKDLTPSLAMSQTDFGDGGGHKDTWHVTLCNQLLSSQYQLIFDGGSPQSSTVGTGAPGLDTSWTASLLTTQGNCRIYKIVAPNATAGHTLDSRTRAMRGLAARQYVTVINDCAELSTPTECPPTDPGDT